jgi:RNA polymerase sigma-70 factor (ECF subfamily)
MPLRTALAQAFRDHERHVWALAYRMTGSAADADDVVQETFARAVARPPARLDEPLRGWLTRVAVNLARDALRRRRRGRYVGPWLPSPVESPAFEEPAAPTAAGAAARYDLRESASFAFLLALEALTPRQRAVLLLRDVLDYSVQEAADALSLSEANVKTTHHRARRAMASYDTTHRPPDAALADATRTALERFVTALVNEDATAAAACLAEGVRALSDGGGEYVAALRPIRGADRVTRFLLGLHSKTALSGRFAMRTFNGLPAIVVEWDTPATRRRHPEGRWAPRVVLRCELDAAGAIVEVHMVSASAKLTAVAPL